MKVFEFNDDFASNYPEDLKRIREYLESHGTLRIKDRRLDDLYRDYCNWKCSASWLNIDEDLLEDFAEYLSKIDL